MTAFGYIMETLGMAWNVNREYFTLKLPADMAVIFGMSKGPAGRI